MTYPRVAWLASSRRIWTQAPLTPEPSSLLLHYGCLSFDAAKETLEKQLLTTWARCSARAGGALLAQQPSLIKPRLPQATPGTSVWEWLEVVARGWVSPGASKDALSRHLPECFTCTTAGILMLLLNGNLNLPCMGHRTWLSESPSDCRCLV